MSIADQVLLPFPLYDTTNVRLYCLSAMPMVSFRLLGLCIFGASADTEITDIRVGNSSLSVSNGGVPASFFSCPGIETLEELADRAKREDLRAALPVSSWPFRTVARVGSQLSIGICGKIKCAVAWGVHVDSAQPTHKISIMRDEKTNLFVGRLLWRRWSDENFEEVLSCETHSEASALHLIDTRLANLRGGRL